MMEMNPPIVPGLTQGAEGDATIKVMQGLSALSPKQVSQLLATFRKLFTPKEPPPEPPVMGLKPPGQFPMLPPQIPTGGPMGF